MPVLSRRDRSLDPSVGDGNHRLARNEVGFGKRWRRLASRAYDTITLPAAAWHIFDRSHIHADYGITRRDLVRLAWRMHRNVQKVWTGTHLRAHFMMAQALMEVPPHKKGVVVECGCFLGGSTANLSLVCALTGRELIVYDSFEGMPPAEDSDVVSSDGLTGFLRSDLERVRDHVSANGSIDVVTFRKGYFRDTLPDHEQPIVLAFFDVDYQASLHDCMIHLWPRMQQGTRLFIDEFVLPYYCALFWSESWWATYMPGEDPPGLDGSGTGIPLGGYFVGPFIKRTPKQMPHSLGCATKGRKAKWEYVPPDDDDVATVES